MGAGLCFLNIPVETYSVWWARHADRRTVLEKVWMYSCGYLLGVKLGNQEKRSVSEKNKLSLTYVMIQHNHSCEPGVQKRERSVYFFDMFVFITVMEQFGPTNLHIICFNFLWLYSWDIEDNVTVFRFNNSDSFFTFLAFTGTTSHANFERKEKKKKNIQVLLNR